MNLVRDRERGIVREREWEKRSSFNIIFAPALYIKQR